MPYSSLPVCQIFYDFMIFQCSEINFWTMSNGYYWGASEFGLWAEVQTCRWLQPKPKSEGGGCVCVCMYSLYLYSMCWVTKKNGLFLGVEKQILLHLFCIHKSRSPKVYMCRNSLETRDVRHNDVHAQWPLPLKIQIWIYFYLLVWFKNNQGVNADLRKISVESDMRKNHDIYLIEAVWEYWTSVAKNLFTIHFQNSNRSQ